ncbi:conserved hypothetical protein [Ricinus communis]|uniref:GATA-type domain-containing protein n=2 Tax=Ricinus communis TaxID=3988 RepID=B9SQ61_RICCO|nr:conserved hypothetical protein [Ricinus communis]
MGNIGNNPDIGEQNFNLTDSQIAWLRQNYMNSTNHHRYGGGAEGSVVGIPISSPNYFNAPIHTMNDYTLLDSTPRRVAHMEDVGGSSSINFRRRDSRRQRAGSYNDPTKRCTNYNCNTNDTPMWRKGPLGPKTLCNACGIKYRKEVEKRRAKEAASSSNGT